MTKDVASGKRWARWITVATAFAASATLALTGCTTDETSTSAGN